MKISAFTPVSNSLIEKKVENKNISNINNSFTSNAIMKNSVAEMIGRSQVVSFKGDNRINGNIFEHTCNKLTGGKENVFYNKVDGSFKHQILNRDGSLKSQIEFYPLQGKEIETQVENGIRTVKTLTPISTITEKYDSKGNQTFYKEIGKDGSKTTVVTEFSKHRRIIRQEKDGKTLRPQVIDLRTNCSVYTGEIVQTRYFDKVSGTYLTENIVTGQILKKEQYKNNGDLISLIEYSEKTGIPTKEVYLDSRNGGYQETNYTEQGVKKSYIHTSKDKRIVSEYLFAEDGKTISNQVQYEYDRKQNLVCETIFIPGTQIIQTQMEYSGEDCTVYSYRKNPNVPVSAEVHVGGRLTEQILFQKDGETYSHQIQFAADGSRKETFYNMAGCRTNSHHYTSDNYKFRTCEYNPHTDGYKVIIEYDRTSGTTKETYYNEKPNTINKIVTKSHNGKLKEVTEFYLDGKTPFCKKAYNYDGSYTEYRYDQDGNAYEKIEYDSNGKRKPSYNRTNYNSGNNSNRGYGYNSGYSQQTSSTARTSWQSSRPISIEDAVDGILNVTAKSNFMTKDINLSQLKVLADFLGLDDPSVLLKLNLEENKNTYRTLAKLAHPDKHLNEPTYPLYEKIFQIINSLHSR